MRPRAIALAPAAAALTIEGRGPRAAYELHTSARAPREVSHEGYRIALTRLDPTPSVSGPIPAADYRATLALAR